MADMDVVARETRFVTGRDVLHGGGGDPSIMTAHGVHQSMLAVAEELWGSADLSSRHVAIQGVGKVGFPLARMVRADGARLTVSDANPASAARGVAGAGGEVCAPRHI